MTKRFLTVTSLCLSLGLLSAADFPKAEITNGVIRARLYLPDTGDGFYRGTRFDWSGAIYSLEYKGHEFYGPWFHKTDPDIHDFVYKKSEIIAGPCSAITGPADEFQPLGWNEAQPGGNFVKIGVGVLRKPGTGRYDNFRMYKIVDPGKWTIRKGLDSIQFTHELADSSSGYAYSYQKTVHLSEGKSQMVLEHKLRNTGTHAIQTSVYNHNFLVLDKQAPGPGLVITVPFQIQTPRPPNKKLASIRGNQIVYLKTLEDQDVVATPVQGFRDSLTDSEIRIENRRLGIGMRIQSNRALSRESLWSIRTVVAMEPFVSITIEPGREFDWKSTYDYYTLAAGAK